MTFYQGTTILLRLLLVATVLASANRMVLAAEERQPTYQGMPVGFTEEGHPFLGQPDAPVTLEEWTDYLCPYCGRHLRQTLPVLLNQYVRTGQIRLVIRDFPLTGLHPTAPQGHVAALCAGEQGPTAYWTMHDALLQQQREWNQLPDPSTFLAEVAKELNLDINSWKACVTKGDKSEQVAKNVEEGKARGYTSTPTFRFISSNNERTYDLVGAQAIDRFVRLADPLIAGKVPPEEPKPEPPELPFWAKAEGLSPDPKRPGFNMAGDPYKGNLEAKLVVIEFMDFQCPACRQHALETQPQIDRELVDTGKVLWVSKQLPLRTHPQAALAAVAAECAGDQEKFWDFHDLLFQKTDLWATEDAENALVKLAQQMSLDMPAFLACFTSRSGLERILQDLYDAQGIVQSTPTFIILHDGKGSIMQGSLPADQFTTMLSKRFEMISLVRKDPNML